MTEPSIEVLARRYFGAFQAADLATMEALLASDFTFTSPFDDHIDRSAYFARCWPHAGSFGFRDIRVYDGGEECVVVYATEQKTGGIFRNAERFRFADGRILSIEVFFGFLPKGLLADPA